MTDLKYINFLLLSFLVFSFSVHSAAVVDDCAEIYYKPGQVYKVGVNPDIGLSFEVDNNLLVGIYPDKANWTSQKSDDVPRHYYFSPSTPDAKKTMLSLHSANGINYRFVVKPDAKNYDSCVVVKTSKDYSVDRFNSASFDQANQINTEVMKRNFAKEISNIKQHSMRQQSAYQSTISSDYTWQSEQIISAHRDNRFTYIKAVPLLPGESIYVVSGMVNNEPVVLDYNYDPLSSVYKINGIHEHLIMKRDQESIEVFRK